MNQNLYFKKIVCAVDMLSNKEFLRLTLLDLDSFADSQNLKVEPVQILEESIAAHHEPELLEKSFNSLVSSMQLKHFLKLKLLPAMNIYPVSYEQLTRSLLKYAEAEQALLAVHSSNNKGLELFFMGSFTESIIKQTKHPVLVINTKNKKVTQTNKILCPVSLKAESDIAMEELSMLAKSMEAKVALFHLLRGPPLLVLSGGELYYDQLAYDYVSPQKELIEEKARILKRNGVETEVIIEESVMKLSEAINLAATNCKADLIAMPVRHKLLRKFSSTAVDVIRSSDHSVMYWHSGDLLLEANKEKATTIDTINAPLIKANAF